VFSGSSGTGKTLAAEVIARELRTSLVRVNLDRVVSKYIGETEKNLARVFEAAQKKAPVLLFDEADALFGKRSEVKDSHDRYANIEVSDVLRKVEAYRGLVILSSNHRAAFDPTVICRVKYLLKFSPPIPSPRRQLRP
jgi:vesicle-fusing ATPase